MKNILFVALILASGVWGLTWKPNPIGLQSLPGNDSKYYHSRLVKDKPFLYLLNPLSHDCIKNGISINLVDEVTDPRDSYNFTISFDLSVFDQVGIRSCIVRARDLFSNSTEDLKIYVEIVSSDCNYNHANYCVHGFCNQTSKYCQCDANYFGYRCSYKCEANTTCGGHGYCSTRGECICDGNYMGPNCSTYCNRETSCSNHGKCGSYSSQPGFYCSCDSGYWGKNCSGICDRCENGHCSYSDGTCDCNPGFYGKFCQYSCENDCVKNGGGCAKNNTNIFQSNTMQCLCPGFRYGDLCENDRTYTVYGAAIGVGLCLILVTFLLTFVITKHKYSQKVHEGYEVVLNE